MFYSFTKNEKRVLIGHFTDLVCKHIMRSFLSSIIIITSSHRKIFPSYFCLILLVVIHQLAGKFILNIKGQVRNAPRTSFVLCQCLSDSRFLFPCSHNFFSYGRPSASLSHNITPSLCKLLTIDKGKSKESYQPKGKRPASPWFPARRYTSLMDYYDPMSMPPMNGPHGEITIESIFDTRPRLAIGALCLVQQTAKGVSKHGIIFQLLNGPLINCLCILTLPCRSGRKILGSCTRIGWWGLGRGGSGESSWR